MKHACHVPSSHVSQVMQWVYDDNCDSFVHDPDAYFITSIQR